MSSRSIEVVNIVPGNFCNLRCSHCVNNSGPDRADQLSSNEVQTLCHELNTLKPKLLIFTGGEPTLHVAQINEILRQLRYNPLEVQITTNGWFAKTSEKLKSIIASFNALHRVQLSFDVFHGSKLSVEDVMRLKEECERNSLKFNITMCLSDSMDLIEANRLSKQLGVEVVYQKVAAIGRARTSGTEFRQARFDSSVLNEKCPNINTLTYVHGRGFTFCCGPLVFETDAQIAHPTIDQHLSSDSRRSFEEKTFGELLNDAGGSETELTPAMSHPCALCYHIQCRGSRA